MAHRLAIVNPASASGRTERRWPDIVDALRARGVELEVEVTRGPRDATSIARAWVTRGGREIVVLGGDGTLNEVVAGCVDSEGLAALAPDITLSLIHQGTGGDVARGLDIPKDTGGAIDVAAGGRPRRVDAGMARYRTPHGDELRAWLGCSNVGLGADVVAKVTGRLKRTGNSVAFGLATVTTLARNRPRLVRMSLDQGEWVELAVTEVTAANNRYMGGGMLVAPDARIDDGMIDVVVVAAASRRELLRTFPKIYKGTHVQHPLVRLARTQQLDIDGVDRPYGVVLDGELVGSTPARFWLLPQALSVRVP